MPFPQIRMRRLRRNSAIRAMVRETTLSLDDIVLPVIACPGTKVNRAVRSMPDVFQHSVDQLVERCRKVSDKGIQAILLFGIPEQRDAEGSGAYDGNGIVQQAIAAIKKEVPHLYVITDICLCGYTTDGHCGVVASGRVHNDRTLELLAKQALSHATAGCDMVAPSGMMDGTIQGIRATLSDNGFPDIPIMSFAVTYASELYGPFREAVPAAPDGADRKEYQMDPSNAREALAEVQLDIEEGSDVIGVKPALVSLDIIHRIKRRFTVPIAAFNVSGEFSMVKAAAKKKLIDEKRTVLELLSAIKRAGADFIITYHAYTAAKLLIRNYRQ